jgi:hypothetical protein
LLLALAASALIFGLIASMFFANSITFGLEAIGQIALALSQT